MHQSDHQSATKFIKVHQIHCQSDALSQSDLTLKGCTPTNSPRVRVP